MRACESTPPRKCAGLLGGPERRSRKRVHVVLITACTPPPAVERK
jgi:hypothetical protein